MALPKAPVPGMVVRYSFLWRSEARRGETKVAKIGPASSLPQSNELTMDYRVRVLPITHRSSDPSRSVELPPKVKRRLGLDAEASWVVLDEVNEFVWPGVDLRPISRAKPGVWTFGILPTDIFDEVRAKLRRVVQQRLVLRPE